MIFESGDFGTAILQFQGVFFSVVSAVEGLISRISSANKHMGLMHGSEKRYYNIHLHFPDWHYTTGSSIQGVLISGDLASFDVDTIERSSFPSLFLLTDQRSLGVLCIDSTVCACSLDPPILISPSNLNETKNKSCNANSAVIYANTVV